MEKGRHCLKCPLPPRWPRSCSPKHLNNERRMSHTRPATSDEPIVASVMLLHYQSYGRIEAMAKAVPKVRSKAERRSTSDGLRRRLPRMRSARVTLRSITTRRWPSAKLEFYGHRDGHRHPLRPDAVPDGGVSQRDRRYLAARHSRRQGRRRCYPTLGAPIHRSAFEKLSAEATSCPPTSANRQSYPSIRPAANPRLPAKATGGCGDRARRKLRRLRSDKERFSGSRR